MFDFLKPNATLYACPLCTFRDIAENVSFVVKMKEKCGSDGIRRWCSD